MLTLWKRKPEPQIEPVAQLPAPHGNDDARRNRQQNIKVSDDCAAAFTAMAGALGLSKAALFEDLVAERLERLRQQGVQVEISGR